MNKAKLEYRVIGKGNTTIVIETGIGCSFYSWLPFVERIKEDFQVVLYHRAGYGNSSEPTNPRSTKYIAEELHELLSEIEVSKDPFILMGHSFGGLCAQQYAKMYPHQLKALILVDSTSCDFQELYELDLPVMKSIISIENMVKNNIESSRKSSEQLNKELQHMIKGHKDVLGSSDLLAFEAFITNPQLFKTLAEEFNHWGQSSKEIKSLGAFPNLPLVVIARDQELAAKPFIEYGIPKNEAVLYEQVWRRLQKELAELSDKGNFVIAEESDHEIHIDRPDVIVEELNRFVGSGTSEYIR